jgi:hypothetical protein
MVELAILIVACVIVFYALPLILIVGVFLGALLFVLMAFDALGFMLIVYVAAFFAAMLALLWAAGRWGESRSNHDA